ncbi:unnamed protein product [Protopolystoma xenopodis]|uniref:ATPase AAA-type core domain-containing protein n=1 Tax=Protopolystoma xenopodis TaxID=117903 RepID=A0A3S5A468_9PLAT|nr:unnamed protein product [Protopolystoma xenopodis]
MLRHSRLCDAIELGENGVILSSGQRACVNLARAAYAVIMSSEVQRHDPTRAMANFWSGCVEAKSSGGAYICLLDDPLAPMDEKLARLVFRQCICDPEGLAGTLRIVATNQHQMLPEMDAILVMDKVGLRYILAVFMHHIECRRRVASVWDQRIVKTLDYRQSPN